MTPEKRKPLTKLEFAKLAVQQNGKCGQCGCKLTFEPHQVRDEHIVSLFGGGTNDLSNRQLWCVPCTKPKDKADAKRHAKIRHNRGETGQRARRERRKAEGKPSSTIRGGGFQKRPDGKTNWPKRKLPTKADKAKYQENRG